jgi:hypothetical protein
VRTTEKEAAMSIVVNERIAFVMRRAFLTDISCSRTEDKN